MDNQHKHIKGYRDLSPEEIVLINEAKALAEKVREYTDNLVLFTSPDGRSVDRRWLALGVTDLQTGFMAVIRSIAQPTTF